MAATLQNEWHLRTVADTSSKACFVCYKPTPKVLITPDSKDYFYICASHLLDRGFASPKVDPKVEKERLEREALQKDIDLVKKEYEEKMKKKDKKGKSKDDDKKKEQEKAEKERDEKIKELEAQAGKKEEENGPRIFELQRNFYQMRIDRLRNIEQAKKQQARMQDPNFFPSTPKSDLS